MIAWQSWNQASMVHSQLEWFYVVSGYLVISIYGQKMDGSVLPLGPLQTFDMCPLHCWKYRSTILKCYSRPHILISHFKSKRMAVWHYYKIIIFVLKLQLLLPYLFGYVFIWLRKASDLYLLMWRTSPLSQCFEGYSVFVQTLGFFNLFFLFTICSVSIPDSGNGHRYFLTRPLKLWMSMNI